MNLKFIIMVNNIPLLVAKKLNEAKTLKEYLDILQSEYETENTKISPFIATMLNNGISKALTITGCKQRKANGK